MGGKGVEMLRDARFVFVHARLNFIFLLGQTPVGIYIFLLIISRGKFCFFEFCPTTPAPPPPPIIVSNDPSLRAF